MIFIDWRLIGLLICLGILFLLECYRCWRKVTIGFLSLPIGMVGVLFYLCIIAEKLLLPEQRLPANVGDWFFLLVGGVILCYCYFLFYYPKTPSGLFFLPLIFLLVGVTVGVRSMDFPNQQIGQYIRAFHGGMLLLACCCAMTGFLTGGMYFLQRRQLRRGLRVGHGTSPPLALPSLEWLATANRRSIKLLVVFLGFGILSGFYVNSLLMASSGGAGSVFFSDPMITGSLVLFILMTVFLCFVSFIRYFQGGKTIALFTMIGFLFLLLLVTLGIFCRGTHWHRPPINDSSPNVTDEDVSTKDCFASSLPIREVR